MGLLLGGSVLTVFELLDLVIFNFVKKLIAQGKLPDPEEKRRKRHEKVGGWRKEARREREREGERERESERERR